VCVTAVQERCWTWTLVWDGNGSACNVPRVKHWRCTPAVHSARRARIRSCSVKRRVHTGQEYVCSSLVVILFFSCYIMKSVLCGLRFKKNCDSLAVKITCEHFCINCPVVALGGELGGLGCPLLKSCTPRSCRHPVAPCPRHALCK